MVVVFIWIIQTLTFNLSNCFIGGNRVRGNGGGIYHNGNLDVSEIVQIYGNKCMTSDGETASNNNVYLTSGKTITNNSGELGNDSYIYVNCTYLIKICFLCF